MRRLAPALMLALAAAPAAQAARWRVDPAQSTIEFRTQYAGSAVSGRFGRWTAAIDFDPRNLKAARIVVDVDLASAATGDKVIDPNLPQADWFATSSSPRARFTSQSVSQTGPGRYAAAGTLAMRGLSVPVRLDFTLAINGKVATAQGQARLDRRAFRMGMDSDASGQWVAFEVPLTVRLRAVQAG